MKVGDVINFPNYCTFDSVTIATVQTFDGYRRLNCVYFDKKKLKRLTIIECGDSLRVLQ